MNSVDQPLVKVEGVCFSRHGIPVLEDISMDIQPSDFLAIIGPNGSGKSTLLKIILGLLRPSRGRVLLFGESPADFRRWTKIGYVAQKATHIDPYFPASVKEVLAMDLLAGRRGVAFSGRKENIAIEAALERMGIVNLKERLVGELSGGQQQRVFIARAIVSEPSVLFLDEPTTGIDFEARSQFYDLLQDLNRRQRMAIVLVTHEIGIISKHVKKLACLNQRLYFHGTHDEFCQCEGVRDIFPGDNHLIDHVH